MLVKNYLIAKIVPKIADYYAKAHNNFRVGLPIAIGEFQGDIAIWDQRGCDYVFQIFRVSSSGCSPYRNRGYKS
jgi:hypothetical protein